MLRGSFKLMTEKQISSTEAEWKAFMESHDCLKNMTHEESPSCTMCGSKLKALNPFFAKMHKIQYRKNNL